MSEPGAGPSGMTYDEDSALPDDGRRYQLVEGEGVETPSPTLQHQDITGEIHFRMRLHVDGHGVTGFDVEFRPAVPPGFALSRAGLGGSD